MKTLAVFTTVLTSTVLFAGSGLFPDPCTVNLQKGLPSNWYAQTAEPERKNVVLLPSEDGKTRTIRITPEKNQILFYCGQPVKVFKGDKFTGKITAKGTGEFQIGYFAYKEGGKNSFTEYSQVLKLTDTFQDFTPVVEVKDNAAGETTEIIRFTIRVLPGNSVEVKTFQAELQDED